MGGTLTDNRERVEVRILSMQKRDRKHANSDWWVRVSQSQFPSVDSWKKSLKTEDLRGSSTGFRVLFPRLLGDVSD
ncbi:Hypothetical predicted protein [Podarcis lilfordi]|uniref:Uncharacterized protein n=1 Tax=Podarcis lilfordi TaxID=74358 RepID=A0AA35KUM1_9SAUR|nr:Hypothetical predicted protein [Podarcis lilfordi]